MFNIFNGHSNRLELAAPLAGEIIPLSKVPDKVFAAKKVGDGVAIKPTNNKLVAPVAGVVKQIFPTKHALVIRTELGLELLIHIGINTVKLDGQGFEELIKPGEEINVGDELIKFDLTYIAQEIDSVITPIVITNPDAVEDMEVTSLKRVSSGDQLLRLSLK